MTNQTIYGIVTDDYEYRRLCDAFFTDQTLAKEHAEKVGGMVEPFLLFDRPPERVSVYRARVQGFNGGEIKTATEAPRECWEYDTDATPEPQVDDVGKDGYHLVHIHGTDGDAVRAAVEGETERLRQPTDSAPTPTPFSNALRQIVETVTARRPSLFFSSAAEWDRARRRAIAEKGCYTTASGLPVHVRPGCPHKVRRR